MAKSVGGKAAKIALAAAGAAVLSAVGTGVVQFCKWAKDPYSTELWFGFLKKGILITKTDEPGHFKVQTGYRWRNDDAEDWGDSFDEPEMEITLPEDVWIRCRTSRNRKRSRKQSTKQRKKWKR